jgi:predicted esterase
MNNSPFKRIVKSNNEIILIPNSNKYDYVFIFMHGLFATPFNFVDKFDKYNGPIPDNFKIILPCAPVQNADFNKGKPTTSWFNISAKYGGIIYEDCIDYNQLKSSANKIEKIIHEEAKLLNGHYDKIFVSGFSQGSCLSFHIGLEFEHLLGGIVCFCGVPFSYTKINHKNKNLKILAVLGGKDEFFQINFAKEQIKNLIGDFPNLIVKVYKQNGHQVYDDELEDLKKFILDKLLVH